MDGVLDSNAILAPVVALVLWSPAVMLWMYAARLPAMRRAGIPLTGRIDPEANALDGAIDDRAQWKAHNYNNLMEQPTLFYAVAIVLALLGHGDGPSLILAWLYVALRILHSLVQGIANVVQWRFLIFIAASFCLIGMALEAAFVVLHALF